MEPEGVTMQSKWVRVGSVRRFDHVDADKAQALKPLEEAAEVFGGWQIYDSSSDAEAAREVGFTESERLSIMRLTRETVLAECADVIQATLNLVAALGVEDFRPWMKACERRNRERGRITDGKVVDDDF